VRQWFFEIWNEPNLKAFWTGSREDYFKFYKVTARAIKRVDDGLRVGGPATADNQWIPEFVTFCSGNSVPVDFVSTHHYPTDAFGKQSSDTVTELAHTWPGVMRDEVAKVCAEARGLPVYYTEWNCSSNPRDPLHDQPFAAALATKIVMDGAGLAQGYSFWTFTDIFEENYFPSVPFHGGFGLLNLHGIAKPVYRAFEIMHRSGRTKYQIEGKHKTVSCWAIGKEGEVTVLLTNFAMPRHPIRAETVELNISGGSAPRDGYIQRIDEAHCNPRAKWESWGCPDYLAQAQVAQLEETSVIRNEQLSWTAQDGAIRCVVSLQPQSVAAVTLEFGRQAA
jgi:xylan 1,4-beta-xylosidase